MKLVEDQVQILLEKCANIPLAIRLVSNTLKCYDAESLSRELIEQAVFPCVNKGMTGCMEYAFCRLPEKVQKQVVQLSFFESAIFSVDMVAKVLDIDVVGEDGAIMLMMLLSSRQIAQRETEQASDDSFNRTEFAFCYSFHPFIAKYLRDKVPDQLKLVKDAQERFCRFVLDKLRLINESYYTDNLLVSKIFITNTSVLKLFLHIIEIAEVSNLGLTSIELKILGNVSEYSLLGFSSRIQHFAKMVDQYEKRGLHSQACFWKTEEIKELINAKDIKQAQEKIMEVESVLVKYHDSKEKNLLHAEMLYHKGRCIRKGSPNYNTVEASRYFQRSLDLYQGIGMPSKEITVQISAIYDAMGNISFDNGDMDNAYEFHKKAASTLQNDGIKSNVYLNGYRFNIGTVAVRRALSKQSVGEELSVESIVLLEEALSCFDAVIDSDREMGRTLVPDFVQKLTYRASALEKLSKFDRALHDREEVINIWNRLETFDRSTAAARNRLDAFCQKGLTLRRYLKTIKQGTGRLTLR